MSRTVKQLVYGSVYLVIALFIFLGIYRTWIFKAPTCFDQIQNQNETGIDCGGPCIPCGLKNLSIDASSTTPNPIALQAGQDQSAILAILKDDSADYGVTFSYDIAVYNIIGQRIDDRPGVSSILPNGTRYIVLTNVASNASDVGVINMTTSNIKWASSTDMTRYNLTINGITTKVGQSGGYVGGTIANTGPAAISAIRLSAIIHDASGKIIGASEADIGSLAGYVSEPFQVFFPTMDVRTASSIDKTRTEVFYEVTQN
jgi:hypothetical protein